MTSSKPYLIRALYEWLLDNQATPYLLVDVSIEGVAVPAGISNDGKVVLNLNPQAIEGMHMSNDSIAFSARFSGVPHQVFCPINSVLAIYAKESGEGMMFDPEDADSIAKGDEVKTEAESKAVKASSWRPRAPRPGAG